MNRNDDAHRTEQVYLPEEIAKILRISKRGAYNLCGDNAPFQVIRFGSSVRINKKSFDSWFNGGDLNSED